MTVENFDQLGSAPAWDRRDTEDGAESRSASGGGDGIDDIYLFNYPDDYSGYRYRSYRDLAGNGGIDTVRLTGVGADEVYVRRSNDGNVLIEAYDSSFSLSVQVSGDHGIERFHFDENGNGVEDDGDHNILTSDELLRDITGDMAIYVNHPDRYTDQFHYSAGDGHQLISDEDNDASDYLNIHGFSADEVILTRNNDAPVRDYNTGNADAPVRTYDDLQLEFPDGKTILLKHALDGSNRGVDQIWFDYHTIIWTKADIMRMARDLVTQSSEDQFFHGFAQADTYIYSPGDGHDTIFEDYNKGEDILVLRGIFRSGVTVSYIDASGYGAYQPGTNDPIEYPDLLIEVLDIWGAVTGSVRLALGAVDGYGVESVLFDSNSNGIADDGEILWDKVAMLAAADADAAGNSVYVFDPDDSSSHSSHYEDEDKDGGTDTLRLTGVGTDEVYVRRSNDGNVLIEAYDNSFSLKVRVQAIAFYAASDIERVHFDENGNGIEDDGDDNILTSDELLTAITEDMAIYVDHPDDRSDYFYYDAGDGHQLISDQDNDDGDNFRIYGFSPGDITLTRDDGDPVGDYTPPNGEDLVRTYDDLQLEFTDGQTILLKHALDGSNKGVDKIWFYDDYGRVETTWDKADMIAMARALVTQSSDDQFFHGFADDDDHQYSQGDGHDTIFDGHNKGNDVLRLIGISSSDVTVSYSNASDSYIDSYINASDYNVGDTTNPDLLLEFGGVGDAATGSVLLALGAVDDFGIESVHFDSNNNGIVDDDEILWDKAAMIAVAAADVYVFNPDASSSYHSGFYSDRDNAGGIDTLRLTGVGEDEVRVRRGWVYDNRVFIEDYDNRFSLNVLLDGANSIDRVHFDKDGNGIEDGDDSILTKDELLTMAATENMAIYVNHGGYADQFFYDAGDGHQLISDQDNNTSDYLNIHGFSAGDVTLTRNDEDIVRGYSTGNAEDLVRTYDDLQLEFRDGKTILLKHVFEGSNKGIDEIHFRSDDGRLETTWDKAAMIRETRASEDPQSSEDQIFHGFADDYSYEYSPGDGHDTIFEGRNKGNDVLALKGGISSSDITVSYSDAASGYYDAGDIANPDLLIEFGGRGAAATGSVLLVLGAVDGFGVESILFDENDNGVADVGEILWDKDYMLVAADATADADASDVYVFNPGSGSGYHNSTRYDLYQNGGTDTLRLTGVVADEVRVRRANAGHVYIEAYDNSFLLYVILGGSSGIDRVHFDQNGNGIKDGDDSILTKDELLTMAATDKNMAIYVNHPDGDWFNYHAGDGHQLISDEDNIDYDRLVIYGLSADGVTFTRNDDDLVRDYNTRNGEDLVRTYDDLQLEFTDGKTILLKYVLEGSNRGVDIIEFDADGDGHYEAIWTKADIIAMASDLVTQSSEDQFFHGFSFAEDDTYIYSRGDGHDTIFEDHDAGNDVLVLKGGISSSDVTVSYSNAGRSYIDASDYGAGDITNPDLLLEFGGRQDAATGSVLLALGAVDGFGIERILFDTNDNGIKDVGEVLWSKDYMLAAADATAEIDDVHVFDPGDYSSYHWGYYRDRDGDGGIDTLRLTGVGEHEVYVRRGPYIGGDFVFIEANDNSFSLLVPLGGSSGMDRFHFDENGNGIEDGDDSILTNNELLRAFTEDMAIYVDSPDSVSRNQFYYRAGDGHQLINDQDHHAKDYLVIYGWSADEVILTRNNDDLVWDYNTGNADAPVRTYDDLQLEFPDGKTILLKYVLEGSDRGVDYIDFDLRTRWDKADMIAMARSLATQSSEDQFFHGFSFAEDDTYEYSRGDGHDTIFEDHDAGNDVLVLKGGISSSDVTVSYSNAGRSYIDASDYGAGDIANPDPDLLIELGGRGDAATGSVLLALGAVHGFGIESVHFDSNNNGIVDDDEISWDKADMFAAAYATAVADGLLG